MLGLYILGLYIVFSLLVGLGITTAERSLDRGKGRFLDVIGNTIFWPSYMGALLARSYYALEGKKITPK